MVAVNAELELPPQLLFTTTVYCPEAASVILAMEGFCTAEMNPFGPVHAYVSVPTPEATTLRFSARPAQIGALLPALDITGAGAALPTHWQLAFHASFSVHTLLSEHEVPVTNASLQSLALPT